MTTVVTGKVVGEGDELLLYDAELRIAGGRPSRHLKRGEIVVTTEDGEAVEVKTTRATVLLTPAEARGTWGELLEDPLSRPFDGEAPGDHVEVRLAGVAIKPGDEVAILGGGEAPLEADGYRGSRQEGRVVDAQVVARGNDRRDALSRWQQEEADAKQEADEVRRKAEREARHTPPDLPIRHHRTAAFVGLALLAGGLALFAAEAGPRTLRALLPAVGIFVTAFSLFCVRRRRFLPSFAPPAHTGHRRPARWSSSGAVTSGFVVAALSTFFGTVLALGFSVAGVLLLLTASLPALALALVLALDERHSVSRLKMLLRAPPHEPGGGGMRTLVITLLGGHLVRQRIGATVGNLVAGFDASSETQRGQADEFEMEGTTADGREVRIRPSGALFGSVGRSAVQRGEGRSREIVVTEEIGEGDQVLVLGRPDDEGDAIELASTGPESLLLLGARGDVLSAARRALWAHRGSVAALLGLAALGLALAWINPYVTRESFGGEVTAVHGTNAVHPGDRCEIAIAHDGEHHLLSCQVEVSCGGVRLHGGPLSGFVDCAVGEDTWETRHRDGPLSLTPPNHLETRSPDGSVVQVLVER